MMNPLDIDSVNDFVNENIVDFHRKRIKSIESLKLSKLLKKNPYLLKAKNLNCPSDLIKALLDAFLSSSEEKLFGDFLEDLAVFVAKQTCDGHKSSAPGVDLEFENKGIYYIVSVKSGPNWGNSSQQTKLADDLQKATTRLKQSQHAKLVQPVLGICYGKTRTGYLRGYLKVVGQNFWYLISEDKDLYKEIIEPIGYRAKEHNKHYDDERIRIAYRLTTEFMNIFNDGRNGIDWEKLVEYNSANFDLDSFL